MIQTIRSSPQVVLFWLVSFIAIAVLWRFMPTAKSQIALLLLAVLVIISTLFKETELPILTTIFFAFFLINYWQINHQNLPIIGTVATAIAVPVLGLVAEKISSSTNAESHHLVSQWLLLGLISAELFSVLNFWPVSFFNRALLGGIIFYFFWRYFLLVQENHRPTLVAHFIFVGLAAILVVGIIIWANFPHLIGF